MQCSPRDVQNQYDCVDLTDNDIRRLGNFPLLPRLETLLLGSNRVSRIEPETVEKLPGLSALVLTNNELVELGDLLPLAGLPCLSILSLHDNPVALKKHYRDFVIHSLPQVKVLDFQKVTETVCILCSVFGIVISLYVRCIRNGKTPVSSFRDQRGQSCMPR